ncbi:nitroreductase family protein [Edaphovirga cremea]|uniref:nitroreductase family protein n=1 Tax=Edaphovirga cremea TaxID=2267246 RepID=UPI000DEF8948|nr:nitroreductase family protein [Edaphovirga cremea]
MDTIEAIKQRRASRAFDSDFTMSLQDKKNLLDIAMKNTPSAFNLQPWRPFLIESKQQRELIGDAVWDPQQRQNLAESSWNKSRIIDCSMLVVLCGDFSFWNRHVDEIWQDASKSARDFITPIIDVYYQGNNESQRDEIMRSCGMFAQNLMLAAKSQGLDSCPMDGFNYASVKEIINAPPDYVITLVICLGKSTTSPFPKIGKREFDDIVHIN